ncbi:MAG TPA: hypothetical protein VK993_10525 [Chthoniobacterales bacterium]|nr:hypothetical protein [Chthoniobacterales bacterium]
MEWETEPLLELGLRLAAVAQFAIALINLSLERLMNWRADVERMPLLIREVFRVHVIFITITVATFALLTWRFAREMAARTDPAAVWISALIGVFWSIRSIMQWTHYSAIHWHGQHVRTALHALLFLGYGALGLLYFAAAFLDR